MKSALDLDIPWENAQPFLAPADSSGNIEWAAFLNNYEAPLWPT